MASCAPEPGALGTRVYRRHCAACHGDDGAGRTRFGRSRPFANLVDGVHRHPSDPASVKRLLLEGDPASPMPPFAGKLSDEEVDAVLRHVETLATRRGTR